MLPLWFEPAPRPGSLHRRTFVSGLLPLRESPASVCARTAEKRSRSRWLQHRELLPQRPDFFEQGLIVLLQPVQPIEDLLRLTLRQWRRALTLRSRASN